MLANYSKYGYFCTNIIIYKSPIQEREQIIEKPVQREATITG